eukprot:CAMPEP_0198109556 /NCGR_PEP_ID=MMETSP1442-20131203/1638_1 /TAXON_ID= /ORGANISM="Craspedostauros australis, Strain CCMP3328" /LENGTH=61 /DNA_ID=CAMNT_0043765289 /DNA_START=57 /DNA_END=239 /DNA_ORIENTATION=+
MIHEAVTSLGTRPWMTDAVLSNAPSLLPSFLAALMMDVLAKITFFQKPSFGADILKCLSSI